MNQTTVDPVVFGNAFAQAWAAMTGTTTKAVGSTPSIVMGYGVGGLFSDPGLQRPVFSAMTLPQVGLQSILPYLPSNLELATYGLLTGVTATTGDDANGTCDPWPTAGLSKLCEHTFVFDRKGRQTPVVLADLFGRLANRADHTDLQLIGGLTPFANPNAPTMAGYNPNNVVNNEIAKKLFELGVAMSRDFARLFYTGTPAANSAGGGTKQYYGLDILINDGYRDAITGIACPAADSIVMSYGNVNVTNDYSQIVRIMANIYYQLQLRARAMGLNPVKWVIVMAPALFWELSEVWPFFYNYNSQQVMATVAANSGFRINMGAENGMALRDQMRGDMTKIDGHFLMISGERVDVIIDESITETTGLLGSFSSSIYFVPLTVTGGVRTTYMEYFDYSAMPMEAIRRFAGEQYADVSDNGRFLWYKLPPTQGCMQISVQSQERLILLTPQIAARLDNVAYTPVQHPRTPFTDSSYYVNGGQTSYQGYGPSLYSPTS